MVHARGPFPHLRDLRHRLRAFAGRTGTRVLDLLYPGFCRECQAPVAGAAPFCTRCASEIRWIGRACERCGRPAASPGPAGCGGCGGRSLFFDRAAAAAEYTGPWRRAVLRFKYLGDQGVRGLLGEALARLYAERFASPPPEAVVPVPPHPLRRLARGRDPVEELALDLGRRAGLPVRRLLRRSRWIPSQTSLQRSERLGNPGGAYSLRRRYRPRRGRPPPLERSVLLLDDVFTTGATASECARVLKQAGVVRVAVLAAARSPE